MKGRQWIALLLSLVMLLSMTVNAGAATLLPTEGQEEVWYEWDMNRPATCTEDGEEIRVSSQGNTQTRSIPATGHSWGGWTTSREATCTGEGVQTRTCSTCGATETQSIPATGHNWSGWSVSRAANCRYDGEETRTCSGCGATESRTVPATGNHFWGEWKTTREPTCTQSGVQKRTCSVCGEEDVFFPAPDASRHVWGDWVTVRAATCTADGEQTRTCTLCGATETKALPASGAHQWGGWVITQAATCVRDGQQTRTCGVCGTTETQTIQASGQHTWGNWKTTVRATCATEGEHVRTCSVCGTVESEMIKRLPHSWGEWTVLKEATCSEEGERSRVCSACQTEEKETLEKLPHTMSEWAVTLEATCAAPGEETSVCQVCGYEEKRSIDALPHTFGEWTVAQEPTCVTEGTEVRTCQVCGFAEDRELALIPHAFGDWTVTQEPTCQAEGQEARICSMCGLQDPRPLPVIDHIFSEWVEIQPWTDWSIGIRERRCVMCGELQHEENEPAGILKQGDENEGVKELQEALRDAGYNPGWPDGYFDQQVVDAVKDLEDDLNKNPDGIGWPGILPQLRGGPITPMLKIEAKQISPDKLYQEGEIVTFELTVTNTSSMDVTAFTFYEKTYSAGGSAEALSWCARGGGEMIPAGESVTLPTVDYTVFAEDCEAGEKFFTWYASGMAGEKPAYSLEATASVLTDIGPAITLISEGDQAGKFEKGTPIPIEMMLTNSSSVPLDLDFLTAYSPEDTVSDEPWMKEPLAPGETYHFTFTTAWRGSSGTEWEHRYVQAAATDPATGKQALDVCLVFLVQQAEGPSLVILAHDHTGIGGIPGETVEARFDVVNNGTEDLKLNNWYGTYGDEDIFGPETYGGIPFPAGESFEATYLVGIRSEDIPNAAIHRTLTIEAEGAESGTPVKDDENFTLWLKNQAELTLVMTQTSEAKTIYTPIDASGNLGLISYSGFVKNTGAVPVKFSELRGYVYPDTEASIPIYNFGGDIELQPDEQQPFSFSWPFALGNIIPGTASETVDGIIDADFIVIGKDETSGMGYFSSNVVHFSYPVSKDSYSWTPPSPETAGIGDGEEEQGSHLLAFKTVTPAELYVVPNYIYQRNEKVTFTVELFNISDEPVYDVEIEDVMSNGLTLPGGTNTHMTPEAGSMKYPIDYTISDTDVDNGELTDQATVHYKDASGKAYFVKSDEVSMLVSDVEVPEGTPSSDVSLLKKVTSTGVFHDHGLGLYLINSQVSYSIVVTNESDHTLTNIQVFDPMGGGLLKTIASLEPKQKEEVTFQYTVQESDLGKPLLINIASAAWVDHGFAHYAKSNPAMVGMIGELFGGDLSITKTVTSDSIDPLGYVQGETVKYQVSVLNVGTENLYGVTVTDPLRKDNPELGTVDVLVPGVPEVFTFEYEVTPDDVDRTYIINQAFAIGYTSEEKNDKTPKQAVSIPVQVSTLENPPTPPEKLTDLIKVTKTVTNLPPRGFFLEDEVILFEITAENTMDEDLAYIEIFDGLTGGVVLSLPSLAAHTATPPVTVPYTVTSLDADNLMVINSATASGMLADGTWVGGYCGPVEVPTGKEPDPEKQPGLTVIKSAAPPANGSFYTEGEPIHYQVTIINSGNVVIDDVIVYDPMSGNFGDEIGSEMGLNPSDSRTYSFDHIITSAEAVLPELWNQAYAVYVPQDMGKDIAYSNIVRCPIGKEEPPTEPPTEEPPTEAPPTGEPPTEEPPTEEPPTDVPPTDVPPTDVPPTDVPPTEPGPEAPGTEVPVTEAPAPEAPPTEAPATEGPLSNPRTAAPATERVTEQAPAQPTEAPEAQDSCVRTLVQYSGGIRLYTLDYCTEHAQVQAEADALLAAASTQEERVAAWTQITDLWREAVNAEYQELTALLGAERIAEVTMERAQFYLQLDGRRAALEALHPDQQEDNQRRLAEMLKNKCVEMCYERHNAPAERVDSLLHGVAEPPLGENLVAGLCARSVTETDTGLTCLEGVCDQHRMAECAMEALASTPDLEQRMDAWSYVRSMWVTELNSLANERYFAAAEEDRDAVSAERQFFGNWLSARETILNLLYPEDPRTVSEVLTEAIRNRVLDQCGE